MRFPQPCTLYCLAPVIIIPHARPFVVAKKSHPSSGKMFLFCRDYRKNAQFRGRSVGKIILDSQNFLIPSFKTIISSHTRSPGAPGRRSDRSARDTAPGIGRTPPACSNQSLSLYLSLYQSLYLSLSPPCLFFLPHAVQSKKPPSPRRAAREGDFFLLVANQKSIGRPPKTSPAGAASLCAAHYSPKKRSAVLLAICSNWSSVSFSFLKAATSCTGSHRG